MSPVAFSLFVSCARKGWREVPVFAVWMSRSVPCGCSFRSISSGAGDLQLTSSTIITPHLSSSPPLQCVPGPWEGPWVNGWTEFLLNFFAVSWVWWWSWKAQWAIGIQPRGKSFYPGNKWLAKIIPFFIHSFSCLFSIYPVRYIRQV